MYPNGTRSLARRLRPLFVGIVALLATLAGSSLPAHAAGGGFNYSMTYAWDVADCRVYVGVVRDVYSPWAAIGGAQASCWNRHSSTSVSVVQLFGSNPSNLGVVGGSTGSAYYTNSLGTGSRIVETPRFCGTGYWAQRATFTISGIGTFTRTTPAAYAPTQCR